MGLKDYLLTRWNAESFARVANSMEKVSSTKRFNSKKAKKLITKYGNLIKKTCNNQSLSERDRYSWSVAISHAYEPSYNFLLLRSVTESQN